MNCLKGVGIITYSKRHLYRLAGGPGRGKTNNPTKSAANTSLAKLKSAKQGDSTLTNTDGSLL